MTTVRPRALVHRGHVRAVGLLLERAAGEARVRARVLAAWEPGSRLNEVDGGLLLRFARPRILDASLSPGHPVLEDRGLLLALPLEPRERAVLADHAGALVTARGGDAVVLGVGREVDPAEWLEVAPEILEVSPLGATPELPPPPPPPDPRQVLGIGPPVDGAEEAIRAIVRAEELARAEELERHQARAGAGTAGRGFERPGVGVGTAILISAGVVTLLAALAGGAGLGAAAFWIAFWLLRAASSEAGDRRSERPAPAGGGARPPAQRERRPGFLRRAWWRFLVTSRITRLAGRAQAAYLRKLLGLFEEGDLAEALRRAIPLRRPGAEFAGPALLPPSRRDTLDIPAGRAAAGTTVWGGPELYLHLEDLYRRTAARLESLGRIDEAAFTLAVLLHAEEEAVSLLERHGRLRQAAELAEGRGLPAGLVVRQWFLAGDVERATRVARARGAYQDAVDRLERARRPAEANALRLIWAEDLAEAGHLEGAVRVVWRVEPARALAARWIELAVAQGGPAGLALLAYRLERDPAAFDEVAAVAGRVAADGSEEGRSRRAAFARGLLAVEPGPVIRRVAAIVARGQLADPPRRDDPTPGADLLALAGDPVLGEDLPRDRVVLPRELPLRIDLDPDDRGLRPALDAAALHDGRVLVALGELGAVLLTRDGREVTRFDVPAHGLVVSETGTRALALAPRGDAVRISRLDLGGRRSTPLGERRLLGWARGFDGVRWAVTPGPGEVRVLDVLRDDLRVLWNLADLPEFVSFLDWHGDALSFEAHPADGSDGAEAWRYEDLVLRERVAVGQDGRCLFCKRAGRGWSAVRVLKDAEGVRVTVAVTGGPGAPENRRIELSGVAELLDALGGSHAVIATRQLEGGARVVVLDPETLDPLAELLLRGATDVRVRLSATRVTVADGLGRVVAIDAGSRRITHDLRT